MYSCSLALMEGHDQFARMAWVKSSELLNFSLLLVWLSFISYLCKHAPAFLSLILVCVYIHICMIVCFYVYFMISTCILYCIHMIVARFSQFHHQCVFFKLSLLALHGCLWWQMVLQWIGAGGWLWAPLGLLQRVPDLCGEQTAIVAKAGWLHHHHVARLKGLRTQDRVNPALDTELIFLGFPGPILDWLLQEG